MDNKRPVGREKNVTGGSSSVNRKGSGLGTGPVGNASQQSGSSSHTQLSGGGSGRRAGTRAGGVGFGGIVILVIFFVVKSLLGGGTGSYTDTSDFTNTVTNTQSTVSTSSQSASQEADTTVAAGSRDKYTTIAGDGSDTVTIMVYMCGTDLESKSGMATSDLNEMLQATLSDKVNLIVYTGGCKAWKNNVVSAKVNQIYQIKDGKFVCLEDNMGTGAMTDPATLTEFIKYCSSKYPADRQNLIFWDHGGGSITGYGYDEKNPNGSMTLAGIDTALSNAGVKFDFIGFDACLMATVENGLMLEKYGDYLIASEETEPGVGWYYTNWLTKLSANTSMSTIEIGKNIVDDFVDVCNQKCRGQKTTLSVVDLAELKNTVPDELTNFAKATNASIKSGYETVSTARKNTREFATSSKIDQIDLVDFCNNLGSAEGKSLASAIEGAVKYNRYSSSMSNAYGLAIYFPTKNGSKTNSAISIFNKIGMNSEYSKCIQNFSATASTAQFATGGQSTAVESLFGATTGGGSTGSSTGANADAISSLLGSLLAGGSTTTESYGMDSSVLDLFMGRDISNEDTAAYVADNYFDANNLVWTTKNGQNVMELPEDQWNLAVDLDLNVFVDDGEGYIDLGYDNVFECNDDGDLIGEYDGTWLAINGQVVPYYRESATEYSDGTYEITGYVPCFYNDTRAELMLVFNTENPNGIIVGARYTYEGETEAVAKSVEEVVAGDKIQAIADYYTYDKEYVNSFKVGDEIVLKDSNLISNVKIDGTTLATYRFTDIYYQNYWTPVIP